MTSVSRSLSILLIAAALQYPLSSIADHHSAGITPRVEPPSWWIGMADNSLQLMIYAPSISQYQVSTQYPGVTVKNTHRTGNSNYLFVDLSIASNTEPGTVELTFSSPSREALSVHYPLTSRLAGSAQRNGFGPADVMYLITPDRFANGDHENDNVDGMPDQLNREAPYGRHGGDLQGIIDRLDYLADLGVTQLWLNPILSNDMPQHSYHGYAQTDLYRVDARLGNNALYRQLVDAAKQRGIGVIQDIVLNHIGSNHWWMNDLPSDDWINNNAIFRPTTHRRETLQDPHVAPGDTTDFADGWFVATMPDMNQRNPLLATYLIQHTVWWIEYAGLSGLRIDTFPYPDHDFTGRWARRITREYPNLNIVGEEWSLNPAIIAYWQEGNDRARENGLAAGVPSMMDFPLHDALIRTLNAPAESWNSGLVTLYEVLASDFLYPDPYQLVVFPDNHDMSRIYTLLGENDANWQMAMTFLLTTRGIPQLFYGTEILMSNPGTESHGVIRSDFPGGWGTGPVDGFTGQGLTEKQRHAQAFLKSLLNWRKTATAIHNGKLTHYAPREGVYTYFRHNEEQTIMVVLNRNDDEASVETTRFASMLGNHRSARNVLTNQPTPLNAPLTMPAKSAQIFLLQ